MENFPTPPPDDNPQQNNENEYFYISCPQGCNHLVSAKEAGGPPEKIVLQCDRCDWKEKVFEPELFQQNKQGDVMLWLYTTKDTNFISSSFQLQAVAQDTEKAPVTSEEEQQQPTSRQSTRKILPSEQAALARAATPSALSEETANSEKIDVPLPSEDKLTPLADTVEIPNDFSAYPSQPPSDTPVRTSGRSWDKMAVVLFWLVVIVAILYVSGNFVDQQVRKIVATIEEKSLVAKVAPSSSQPVPENYASLQKENQQLKQQMREVEKQQQQQQQKYQALLASYQSGQRKKEELESQLKSVSEKQQQLTELKERAEKYARLEQKYQYLIQELNPEYNTISLTQKEKDFHTPYLSNDGKIILYQDGQNVTPKTSLKRLQAVFLHRGKLGKPSVLFETKPVKEEKKEIPFIFDWDGESKVVLLTRINGLHTISYLNLQTQGGKVVVSNKTRLISVRYPHVLGPPSISPNGNFVSFIHHSDGKNQVKVYSLQTQRFVTAAEGGGDTMRSPIWSPDSRHLFFLEDNQRSIVVWKLPNEKRVKVLPRHIYGRYLSCSPDGRYLAFFQNSQQGKGLVNLCLWQWQDQENKVEVHEQSFSSVETCWPQWSPNGRFLSFIESGAQDKVLVRNNLTEEVFSVFQKQGKIAWVYWAQEGTLIFNYREGLFTRPYLVNFSF